MFKVLTEGCEPTRGTKYSACVDLFASEDVAVDAGETKVVGLGVCIDLDALRKSYRDKYERGYKKTHSFTLEKSIELDLIEFISSHYLQVALRSSIGKKGLIMPNGVGIIDMDYKDEIKIIIHNPLPLYELYDGSFDYIIKKGDKIAQITMLEHQSYLFGIDTDAVRDGGFGSTDKQDSIYPFSRVANDNS